MAEWLKNKVALVTGGGSGIGKAIVESFIQEGAKVVAFDISEQRLKEFKSQVGDDLAIYKGDVRSLDDNKRAVELAVSQFGKLDVFVGNAGIHDGNRTLDQLEEDKIIPGFEDVFQIDVLGYLLGVKAAVPQLRKTKGNIILTLSTSSFYTGGGGPIYVAAKHATLGLMRELAFELAPDIRVNGVAPAGTATNLASAPALARPRPAATDGAAQQRRPNNPLQVNIQSEDHAASYVLLASDRSRATTGAIINTDAGRGVIGRLGIPAPSSQA